MPEHKAQLYFVTQFDLTYVAECVSLMSGGGFMEKGVRMQITLATEIAEKLDLYCKKKGVRRSAVISFALDELWKEEHSDEK